MKSQWLPRTLISGPNLCLCLTEKQFRSALADCGIDPRDRPPAFSPGRGGGSMYPFRDHGRPVCVVVLRDWEGRDPITVASLLMHEAVHVWQEFRDHIGEDQPSSEFEAYCIQTISQELMLAFRAQTSAKPRRSGRGAKRTRRTA